MSNENENIISRNIQVLVECSSLLNLISEIHCPYETGKINHLVYMQTYQTITTFGTKSMCHYENETWAWFPKLNAFGIRQKHFQTIANN